MHLFWLNLGLDLKRLYLNPLISRNLHCSCIAETIFWKPQSEDFGPKYRPSFRVWITPCPHLDPFFKKNNPTYISCLRQCRYAVFTVKLQKCLQMKKLHEETDFSLAGVSRWWLNFNFWVNCSYSTQHIWFTEMLGSSLKSMVIVIFCLTLRKQAKTIALQKFL